MISNVASRRFLLPALRRVRARVTCRDIHVDGPPIAPALTTSYAHGTSSFSLLDATVGEALTRAADAWPDREAAVFAEDGVRKTFADFHRDAERAAAGLLALGLRPGERLGIWGPNTYEWLLFQFATAKAGIIMVSVNPAYRPEEAEFALRKVGCKALVCPTAFKSQNYCDMLRLICPEIPSCPPGDIRSGRLPDLRSVIVLDSRQDGMFHADDVMAAGDGRSLRRLHELQKSICCDGPINVLFTSGTTGRPKGATLTHRNVVNNAFFVGKRMGFDWRPRTRICLPVPLYHCFGSVGGGVCMAVHGVTLVFPSPAYSGRRNLAAMQDEKCTFVYGTPTMFVDMISQPDVRKYDLSSVVGGVMAGSPCPPELVQSVISVLGIQEVTIGYGTTENSPVTFCGSPLDNLRRKCRTVGYVMEHTEAKIVDPASGRTVPLGRSGEILIRGYCVMRGYWNDPDKTRECIGEDGWYKTGDIGSLDAFGYCRIQGRIKDMIIRGGENVYPAEIEHFLHTHPKIQEVQVVGVSDARMGEEICACVKVKDDAELSQEEVKTFCGGKISHFKIPRYVVFVSGFPLTVTGKVQKQELRQEAEKRLGIGKAD
ncbi:medium-chain acyl-CoA ligase ACSF2, mitochondrial [Corythoichthys intestinalis]|uniref:medium-chain acyl-CoA ligase ACSF2, mitochondrial n=1 Tax=Corythoichthys intestinalis TaxID=161448 RepID=UPI0025A6219C|nr:medium-chain acyl-CoA ligase ACSF2, mitochondrial [Corythoichthys intestinalis]XP_061807855.1 medium-chain acyl-CoA ligase ACSF2, mitochondrial-like [Nerophis lumbriciformis]